MSGKTISIPSLIATSVVRGSRQGDSHGGVFTIDFKNQQVEQEIDWNTTEIDFAGRGWDRGLRGIDFYRQDIYIAASDELFVFNRLFELQHSHRNPFLKHAHEICRKDNLMFVTSTGYDSILVFDVEKNTFIWGLYFSMTSEGWSGQAFDPNSANGPPLGNKLHINSVYVDDSGIYVSGLRTKSLLHIDKDILVTEYCSLPEGVHNARPYKDGVLFNDTGSNCVRFAGRGGSHHVFKIPRFDEKEILHSGVDDSKIARQGFGRGLCVLNDGLIAAGSSPSTISLYDFESGERVLSVNMTMDIRNAIHGLEIWPFR